MNGKTDSFEYGVKIKTLMVAEVPKRFLLGNDHPFNYFKTVMMVRGSNNLLRNGLEILNRLGIKTEDQAFYEDKPKDFDIWEFHRGIGYFSGEFNKIMNEYHY